MAHMKGFIHIVEIVIVILTMFTVVMQLLSTPQMDTDWSRVALSMKANDLLYSMEASGINWFDRVQVEKAINGTLNMSNVIYSVELGNVIKPLIRVGCVCYKEGELARVENALSNPAFSINGQPAAFEVANITAADATSPPDMPFDFDVIVAMDHNISYTNAYRYLAKGGGIVEVRDLNLELAGQNAGDMWDVHNRLFGIEWSNLMPGPSSAEITFNAEVASPKSSYYNVYNYFHHIPNSTGMKINESHKFTDFLEDTEKLMIISPSAKTLLNQSGTGSPALVLNKAMAENKGRTAWLSGMPAGMSLTDDDKAVLMKSLVVWASGERYNLIPGIQMVSSVKATMFKLYNKDMMQPIEVTLSMGAIY